MHKRLKEWLARYGPAEIAGKSCAVILSTGAQLLWHNGILSAYFGTVGDNLGYYGMIIGRETHKKIKLHRRRGTRYGFKDVIVHARDLIIEFGPGELLDSLIIRPFTMAVFPLFIPQYQAAILLASITADTLFYIPTVISYELKKKRERR